MHGGLGFTTNQLNVEVFDSFARLNAIREEWDSFVEQSGGDIYFTSDWLEAWWNHYGAKRLLRCFFIRSDQPVAALPFCIQVLRLGPISIRLARFVGADSTIPVFTPPIEKSRETYVWKEVLNFLFKEDRCDAVSLTPLSGLTTTAQSIGESAKFQSDYQIVRDEACGKHTIFMLPQTSGSYLNSLTKKIRGNLRRDLRNLTHQKITYCTLRGEAAIEWLDKFIELHQTRWELGGKQGHFADWPHSIDFNRSLVERLGKKDRVRFYLVIDNGDCLAAEYTFLFANRSFWRLPARKIEGYANAGVGRVCLVKMIEALIDEGVSMIEAGPGHYDYKIRHVGSEFPLRRLVLGGSSIVARIKAMSLIRLADLVHLLYYRIWFLKVAPRFAWTKRPLWSGWRYTRI
jgi:CelD/BcsL family acetyltransferase involved in cellulose biosynthesis